jgi:hypothetical protein
MSHGDYNMRTVFIAVCRAAFVLYAFAVVATAGAEEKNEYQPIMWVDLLPLEDFQALFNPPPITHGAEEDDYTPGNLRGDGPEDGMLPADDPFSRALVSKKVKPEMNDLLVRLPGFIVPLAYNDEEEVIEFFLVPYFGACIHVPPPPPNQIVFVSYPQGLRLDALFEPFDIAGKLTIAATSNRLGDSAYRIDAVAISPYVYEEVDAEEE